MELKKSKKADLERNRGMFLQIGLVTVLSLMLIAFEWTSKPKSENQDKLVADAAFEVEEMAKLLATEGGYVIAHDASRQMTDLALLNLREAEPQGKAGDALFDLAEKLLKREQ